MSEVILWGLQTCRAKRPPRTQAPTRLVRESGRKCNRDQYICAREGSEEKWPQGKLTSEKLRHCKSTGEVLISLTRHYKYLWVSF